LHSCGHRFESYTAHFKFLLSHTMKSAKASRPRVILSNRAIVVNKEKKILLIQRTSYDSWSASLWEFPGGKLDEGQDVSHALEREVFEETGLLVIPTHRVAYYES